MLLLKTALSVKKLQRNWPKYLDTQLGMEFFTSRLIMDDWFPYSDDKGFNAWVTYDSDGGMTYRCLLDQSSPTEMELWKYKFKSNG